MIIHWYILSFSSAAVDVSTVVGFVEAAGLVAESMVLGDVTIAAWEDVSVTMSAGGIAETKKNPYSYSIIEIVPHICHFKHDTSICGEDTILDSRS